LSAIEACIRMAYEDSQTAHSAKAELAELRKKAGLWDAAVRQTQYDNRMVAEWRAKAETLDRLEALVREHDGRNLRLRHWATGDYWMITAGVGTERRCGYHDKRGNSIADAVSEFVDFEAKQEEVQG
jgi:hypothetical protein